MLYEITYDGGKRLVRASTDEEALTTFAADWTRYGDALPPAYWITGRWN